MLHRRTPDPFFFRRWSTLARSSEKPDQWREEKLSGYDLKQAVHLSYATALPSPFPYRFVVVYIDFYQYWQCMSLGTVMQPESEG